MMKLAVVIPGVHVLGHGCGSRSRVKPRSGRCDGGSWNGPIGCQFGGTVACRPINIATPTFGPKARAGRGQLMRFCWNGGKQVHRSARWVAGIGPLVGTQLGACCSVFFSLPAITAAQQKNAAPPSRHVQFRSCGPLRCGHGAVGPGDRLGAIATCSACSHGVEVVGSTEWHFCNRYVVPGCARWSGCIWLCGGARGSSVVQGWVGGPGCTR